MVFYTLTLNFIVLYLFIEGQFINYKSSQASFCVCSVGVNSNFLFPSLFKKLLQINLTKKKHSYCSLMWQQIQ